MKLFYHFLFFVCASLILLACASLFNSDSKIVTPANRPSRSVHNTSNKPDNSVSASAISYRFMLTNYKIVDLFDAGTKDEKECACSKHNNDNLRMAIMDFGHYQKLKF